MSQHSLVIVSRLMLAAAGLVGWPALAAGQVFLYGANGADGGRFGKAVATISDIDHDGTEDVLVGEPNFAGTSEDMGRVTVYSGKTGASIRTHVGDFANELFGTAVSRIGDLDGDGVGDYLVGAPGFATNQGIVYSYSGATGLRLHFYSDFSAGFFQGRSLGNVGDINGDGIDDVAAGAPDASRISFFSGTGAFLYGKYAPEGGAFGHSVAGCGDLNHDGLSDYIVGWPLRDATNPSRIDVGRVSVYNGNGDVLMFMDGEGQFDRFGFAVASLGDVDHDGVNDFAVGAPGSTALGFASGFVRAYSGKQGAVLWTTFGSSGDNLGFSLAPIGDINRDGVPDAIAGSPTYVDAGGSARVLSGSIGKTLFSFVGNTIGSMRNFAFGAAVAGGDFNRDGIADVVIGDPSFGQSGGTKPGQVQVFLGCPAFAENYGDGWPGRLGVPQLIANSVPAIGGSIDLFIGNSLGAQTPGLLLIGFDDASTKLPSGAKLLVLPSIFRVLSIPAAGMSRAGPLPNDPALCFLDLYFQTLELDSFAIGGMSLTKGLRLRIGFDLN